MPKGDNRPAINWQERGFDKPGPKTDARRIYYAAFFGLSPIMAHKVLSTSLLNQLDGCADDDARRVLLPPRKQKTRRKLFAPEARP